MSKKVKAFELDTLRKAFAGVKDYVLVEPLKVDAATDYNFRKNLRAKKIRCQMVKNSFAKKVLGENGINVDGHWSRTTLLCWGGSSIKELGTVVDEQIKVARKDPKLPEKLKIKTGVADGQAVSIDVMKTMPTREEAIGGILQAILAPGSQLANLLTAPASSLAGILKAIEEKAPAEAAPEAAPAAAG